MSYRRRHIKNKIHKIKPRKRLYKKPIFWVILILAIGAAAAIYFLIFYPGIQIDKIEISGNKNIGAEEIQNFVKNKLNKNISQSIFLASPEALSNQILKAYPEFESAQISKKFPKTIEARLKERVPAAVYCASYNAPDECYFVDGGGVAFRLADKYNSGLPVIISGQPVDKNVVNAVEKTEEILSKTYQIEIKEAFLSSPFLLNILTSENWRIYLDPTGDIGIQLQKMTLLLENEIPAEARGEMEYIDLRFKDRGYYK